jgi:PDZ domain-containing protein
VLGTIAVLVIVAGFLVHLPYTIISPGDATPLDASVVQINGATTYPSDNHVRFLTVRVTNQDPNLWRLVAAWLDPDVQVEKRENVVGCLSPEANVTYNQLLMEQSQSNAKYVALTHLGYTVTADATRPTIVYTCPGDPAYGKLEVGDVVLTVGGTAVATAQAVGDTLRATTPGQPVTLTVDRAGATESETVVTGQLTHQGTKCEPIATGHEPTGPACVGAATQDFTTYHFPIDITINTARVGGPSAGLAFTLAIIDDLTPGKLTDGKQVAVTGAIASDGSVQPVGGVEQKAITARHNGVDLMLVPAAEVKDARKGADGMKVAGVSTLDDALAALTRVGGTAVPPSSSTAARS